MQKIATRKESQEELFQLFNLFADARRQMVFTSNVQPQDIDGLDDRLASRLVSGLVATISPPDAELRRTIVTSRLAREGETADAELIDYLVERDADSVRSLLSMVQRVIGGAEAMGAAPTVKVARELLEEAAPRQPRRSLGGPTSAVLVSPTRGIRSREKFVWEWPDPMARIMDELT
jgi:chromosomal replication initiator protein